MIMWSHKYLGALRTIGTVRITSVFLISVLCTSAVFAQDTETGQPSSEAVPSGNGGGHRRILADHRFIPSPASMDPFISTTVSTRTGYGASLNLSVPRYDLNGNRVGTATGSLTYFTQEFGYTQRIFDWASLGFAVAGSGRIAGGFDAMLAEGINANIGYSFIGKARLYQSDRMYLTMVLGYSKSDLTLVTPYEWLRSVIDNGILRNETKLVNNYTGRRYGIGPAVAYAFSDWLGGSAFLEAGMQNPLGKDRGDMTYYNGVASVDVDFGKLTPVDLGLVFFGRYERDARTDDNFVTDGVGYGAGVTYTGAVDFHVGLHLNFAKLTARDTGHSFDAASPNIFLRYDF